MALKLVTAPAVEPISLIEAKAHLRVDHTDEDVLIALLITAARDHVDGKEGFLGRALVTQTWDLIIDSFPVLATSGVGEIMLPLPPLQSVTGVYYFDASGDEQTIDADDYTVDDASEPAWVVPNTSWPTGILSAINAVRVRFVAGYPPSTDSPPNLAANVPASIKAAILLTLGSLYANRESVVVGSSAVQLPWSAEQLLRPHRVYLSMA